MCGIAGVVAPVGAQVDRNVLARMTETIRHRGPDASGVELPDRRVGLGHRRLSIIDLATGAQPMASPDRSVWITYNGEIFNFRELRSELQKRGRPFATQSDTEVLLALYELDGIDGFRRLRGQYAFAIWDARVPGGKLVAARDPIGIKPLYYSFANGMLLFASEPRAILQHPEAPRQVDPFGVHLFLRYRFIPAPRTAWKGMQKLRPGEILTLENGVLELSRQWTLDPAAVECDDDLGAAQAELGELLPRAVDRQKVADVEVGAFLSGGIDSSTTAALLMQCADKPITTFTIGFESEQHDESAFAEEVAQHIHSNHVSRVMSGDLAAEVIHDILDHLDEPFGDPSLVPTWFLCRLAAERHKVVLSGDGGDELFGGYGRTYRALGLLEWPRPARPFYRALQRLRTPGRDPARWTGDDDRIGHEYIRLLADVDDADSKRLYGPELAGCVARDRGDDNPLWQAVRRWRGLPPFSRILMADMEAHLADYHLVKVERASMAHGLEVRVPLLDIDLVERAFRWTAPVRLSGGRTKGLLRDAVGRWLPENAMTRPKRGFGPPLSSWFREGLGEFARAQLFDGAAVQSGFLSQSELTRMLAPGRKRLKGSRIWRLLVLEHWLRKQTASIPVS